MLILLNRTGMRPSITTTWTDENDPNSCYQIPWAWDSQDTSEFENSEAVESDTSAVYGKLYAEANDEQKRMIENIEREFGGFNYDYKKKILQIMGRLPSDLRRS